jgi:serine phosphatase RsbU (regulator of sigma subunit)/anti-sigma regulatory factor (Ser/Thr protein kinase)
VIVGEAEDLWKALRSGRAEQSAVRVVGRDGVVRDATVDLRPVEGSAEGSIEGRGPAAFAVLTVSHTSESSERFGDRAALRRAVLTDSLAWTGALLDPDQMARGLMSILVPNFCDSGGMLMVESALGDDGDEAGADGPDWPPMLRRMAVSFDDDDRTWEAVFPTGEVIQYPTDTPYSRCLESGRPISITDGDKDSERIQEFWGRTWAGDMLKGTSMLLLPLVIRGCPLGFFVCTRAASNRPFDEQDVEVGVEFAARAALYVDNARRYSRERETALTLQRSLLPTDLSAPSPVEVHHRYLPGSRLMEVGGDWYESIALPGGRVALVVGDVAGHGVQAAVTMGRLRSAIHTLAGLELTPAEALQRLDGLMRTLGNDEPHFATCAYAIFDAVTGILEGASAGHLPPLLARPGEEAEFLDVPPAPPLGVGDGTVISREFEVEDGAILVLYTDGLVENRSCDIDDGLVRLRRVFGPGAADRPLADLCQNALDGVFSDHHRDDIAVLVTRLGRIPASDHVTWEMSAVPSSVREARTLIRDRLARWGLGEVSFTTELVATELLTNAVRHVGGRMALSLIRDDTSLVCEVYDSSDAMPRQRHPEADTAETGRGLHVVTRLSRRWGVRRTIAGKVVWGEIAVP